VVGLLIVLIRRAVRRDLDDPGPTREPAATLPALAVTAASMGIGAPVMLPGGIVAQGLPALSLQSWAIVGWLAAVNTAFAFTLWNHTRRTLPAVESSIINTR